MIPRFLSLLVKRSDFLFFLLLILLVYFPGMFVPLMDNDSAHHANIALNMHITGNYAFLIDYDKPYLDKPHLLFWLVAFSYKIFGVTTFAYKLPSFLFTILGTYSTYRLGILLYNSRAVGKLAALILSSSCAYILANNDVRMDAILTASIIFSIWQLIFYIKNKKKLNLISSALGLALGFATKGMIGVVIPTIAVFIYLVYERNWRMIFHWRWFIIVVLFVVFISPVLYSYYLQFDLHPETTIRGRKDISGVKFILWDQNFERMQGGDFGKQASKDYLFFFHTFIWSFLPWSLLATIAAFSRIKTFVKNRFKYIKFLEFLSLGSLIFFMFLFSFSNFKLPHYLNVLLPLFAILLAGYLHERRNNVKRLLLFSKIQFFVLIIILLLAGILLFWVFPVKDTWVASITLILFVLFLSVAFSKRIPLYTKIIGATILCSISTFFTLNANFYPNLLTYQAGNQLALASKKLNINQKRVFTFQQSDVNYSYHFYTATLHKAINLNAIKLAQLKGKKFWVFTDEVGKVYLQQNNIQFNKVLSNIDYRITRLNFGFLNPDTRETVCGALYLIEL